MKAYIHGHVHTRYYAQHQGIYLINTPATSTVGDPVNSTTGWTIAALTNQGVVLTTRTNDPQHQWNGQQHS